MSLILLRTWRTEYSPHFDYGRIAVLVDHWNFSQKYKQWQGSLSLCCRSIVAWIWENISSHCHLESKAYGNCNLQALCRPRLIVMLWLTVLNVYGYSVSVRTLVNHRPDSSMLALLREKILLFCSHLFKLFRSWQLDVYPPLPCLDPSIQRKLPASETRVISSTGKH